MKNEIMNRNTINALANKELRKNLNEMLKALETGKKATWQFAFACNDIVAGEQFKEDFKSLSSFASYVGMNKSSISQMTNAVKFVKRENLVPYVKDKSGKEKIDLAGINIIVSNAYVLSVLSEDDFDDFSTYCENNDINVYALSQVALKSTIKDWKKTKEATEEATESNTEKVSETRINVANREEALLAIKALMEQYNITIDDITE